jgi:hypothetical protein
MFSFKCPKPGSDIFLHVDQKPIRAQYLLLVILFLLAFPFVVIPFKHWSSTLPAASVGTPPIMVAGIATRGNEETRWIAKMVKKFNFSDPVFSTPATSEVTNGTTLPPPAGPGDVGSGNGNQKPPDSNDHNDGENKKPPYFDNNLGTFWNNPKSDVPVQLANFSARIITDVYLDDGIKPTIARDIVVRLNGRETTLSIPASEFPNMGWVAKELSGDAIIMPGASAKDHLRAAIQFLSSPIPERTALLHTGLHLTPAGWVYAHRGGAIGADGAVKGIATELPVELAPFTFPTIPTGPDLADAVRTSLKLFNLASAEIMAPVMGAVYRSVIGGSDFSVLLFGKTGQFKTALAILAQQHFGAGFDERHLPAAWSATDNALEAIAFSDKDAILVIDDFKPGADDRSSLNRKADRIIRAQANQMGRARLRSDTSIRPAKWPRGLILSTGEELPEGQSLLARAWVVEIPLEAIDSSKLTICQKDGAAGIYAKVTAAFIKQLVPDLDAIKDQLSKAIEESRSLSGVEGHHKRTPDIMTNLMFAWDMFVDFAVKAGALTVEEAEDLQNRVRSGLNQGAALQISLQRQGDPAQRFMELLNSAILSGKAHVANRGGMVPKDPKVWGYRLGDHGDGVWRQQGVCVGWVEDSKKSQDDADLFLDPHASYKAADEMVKAGVGNLPSEQTLWKRLNEAGLLVSTDKARQTLKVQRKLRGKLRTVLHLRAGSLSGPEAADYDDDEGEQGGNGTPEGGR